MLALEIWSPPRTPRPQKLKGLIKMLAGDFSMNPETTGFLQLAINEEVLAQEVRWHPAFGTALRSACVPVCEREYVPVCQ